MADTQLQLHQQYAVPVVRRSTEWGWLEYLLTVSCQTSKLRLRAAWSILNSRLSVENEQRCRGLLQLHAWFPVSDLPSSVSVHDVCQNGFPGGTAANINFHIGNIQLPGDTRSLRTEKSAATDRGHNVKSRGRRMPQGRRLYEFLFCRVGVGRSFLVESAAAAESLELPPEYDSFFLSHDMGDTQVDLSSGVAGPHQTMHHEYIIRDTSQAIPMYLVHFEYDPEAEEQLSLPLCDNCGVEAALIYCEADAACFCEACDKTIHAVNTIAQKHVRVLVNERPDASMGSCSEHPEEEAGEFCIDCGVPICVHCKSFGSHAAGEAARHRLTNIPDAYKDAVRQSFDDEGGNEQWAEMEKTLADLDARMDEVQQTGTKLEDMVYDHIQQTVLQGRGIAEEQANRYLSDELEVKRQLDQSMWLEAFLEDHAKTLQPADFLQTWVQHCLVREDLAKLGEVRNPPPPMTLKVDGRLRLVVKPPSMASLQGPSARPPATTCAISPSEAGSSAESDGKGVGLCSGGLGGKASFRGQGKAVARKGRK